MVEYPQHFYGAVRVIEYKPHAPIPHPQTPFGGLPLQFPHRPLSRRCQAVYRRCDSLLNLAGQGREVILGPVAPANLPPQGKSKMRFLTSAWETQ